MKHPSEATLALHAGGDLGTIAGWQVRRHLAGCGRCRDEAAAFHAIREITPDLAEIPGIAWNRLAGEMKANIRLGLAAGECVRDGSPAAPSRPRPTLRPAIAMASMVALVATGIVLERPKPRAEAAREGVVVQHIANGIQVSDGSRGFGLMHTSVQDAREVTYTVGAQGSMRARYVDPQTGQVTINNVYAE